MGIPREVSPDELAAVLGVTSRAVGKLSEQGILRRVARGRFDLEQARHAEHLRHTREGEYLPRESVARTWKAMIASARSVLLAMPSRLALQLARTSSPQACEVLVRRAVNTALSRLVTENEEPAA